MVNKLLSLSLSLFGIRRAPELQDKTMNVDGLRCILYARICIPYTRNILYHYIQTGRPPVPISSEFKLKTNSRLAQYLSNLLLKELTESASTT